MRLEYKMEIKCNKCGAIYVGNGWPLGLKCMCKIQDFKSLII